MQPTLKKLMQNYFSTIKLSIQNAIKFWFHYEVYKTQIQFLKQKYNKYVMRRKIISQ